MDALATTPIRSGSIAGGARPAGSAAPATSASDDALDAAAKGFEKLMVQRLLTEARKTRFGDEPSNAQGNYDAMFDEKIAGLISDSGTLGLADSLRRSLGGTGQLSVQQSAPSRAPTASPLATGLPVPATGERTYGLDASSLSVLRSLVEPGARPGGGIDAAAAHADAIDDAIDDQGAIPLLASLAAPVGAVARPATGSGPEHQRDFLSRLHPHAQDTARRLGTSTEAVLAVAALESGWGRRPITDAAGRDANNLFGIKSHGHDGPSVTHRTTEYIGGQPRRVEADFRRYADAGASVQDFGDFLIENPRYAPALEQAADPPRFLRALQEAGYATDPNYADKAIRVMQRVREHLTGDDT